MDWYSRTVVFLKVLFPLAALGILGTLFLLSRSTETNTSIPFAQSDIENRLRDQRLTAPLFSGSTPKGDRITVTAAQASPGFGAKPAQATDLAARIELARGGQMTLVSDAGTFDLQNDLAMFQGNVRISSSTGYVVLTDELHSRINEIGGKTPGTVTGRGPIGNFTAGQMVFETKNGDGLVHMLFKNGVRLVYDPKQTER